MSNWIYKNKTDQLNFDWISAIVCTSTWGIDEENKFESRTVGARMSSIALDASWSRPFYIFKENVDGSLLVHAHWRISARFYCTDDRRKLSASVLLFHECFSFFSNCGASRLQRQNMNIVIIVYLCLFVYCTGWDLIALEFLGISSLTWKWTLVTHSN